MNRGLAPGVIGAFLIASSPANLAAGECGFRHTFTRPDEGGTAAVKVAVKVYEGDPLLQLSNRGPLLFLTSLKVNTDGTKISYHQDDPTGHRCESTPTA
jgi:hypothetical protein